MPIVMNIAVLAACTCLVILTILSVTAAVYLKARMEIMEKGATQLKVELSELILESQGAVREMRLTAARISKPIEDIEHITHAARGWTDRADRLVDAVGNITEPPIFFMAKNVRTIRGVFSGVLQMLLNPKH